jgi:hypothetical protein
MQESLFVCSVCGRWSGNERVCILCGKQVCPSCFRISMGVCRACMPGRDRRKVYEIIRR